MVGFGEKIAQQVSIYQADFRRLKTLTMYASGRSGVGVLTDVQCSGHL